MSMSSAFQNNCFQHNAFQLGNADTTVLLGGGSYGYTHHYAKYKEEEFQREKIRQEKAELKRIEEELAKAEAKKLELAQLEAEEIAAEESAALEALLLAQINELRFQRALLIQRIMDDEALLVILLAMKFRRLRAV